MIGPVPTVLPVRFGVPPLVIRLLGPADVPALRALRRLVLESLPHPDYYRVEGESSDFVAKILTPGSKAHGLILGVFQKEILMAYGALEFPGPGEVNRGVDLSLPVDQLPLVAHMTSAMVAPSHQGRGLHDFLIAARLEAGVAQGRRHFLTTVSPRNHPSWGNLVARGLHIKRLVQLGGGLVRALVHIDHTKGPQVFATDSIVSCDIEDLSQQWALLAAGFWGWRKDWAGKSRPMMVFGRPLPLGQS